MNKLTIDDLLNLVKSYNPDEVEIIKRAYYYADNLHSGQKRQSGEPYIIHPLNVSYILASMHADRDTICAGLLHDTLEDTHITKEDISHDFNPEIASLVDGVTKISKLNFSTKQEQNVANTRKIITGITSDVRIIIIKLADRLHNMRTLEYKTEFKQKENSLETMDIFVPLAYYIGAYRIKSELEDRYSSIPDSVYNLMDIAYIKSICKGLYIEDIKETAKELRFKFVKGYKGFEDIYSVLLNQYKDDVILYFGETPSFAIKLANIKKETALEYYKKLLEDISENSQKK